MKKTKFSEERIAYILRQAEGGTPATEVCRQNGISEQTLYRWKRKYGGMGVPEHPLSAPALYFASHQRVTVGSDLAI